MKTVISRRHFLAAAAATTIGSFGLAARSRARPGVPEIFAQRGYYILPCRTPTPSLECYTYLETHEEFGEPWLQGRRQVPFGFGWLPEVASPYRELPVRAARVAYREYAANPDLSEAALHAALDRELFEGHSEPVQVEDVLDLCRVFGTE